MKLHKTRKFCRIMAKIIVFIVALIALMFLVLGIRLYMVNYSNYENPMFTEGELKVVMLDVDNGDCILLLQEDQAMLVDTGYFYTYSKIEKALKEYDVKYINKLIITHPHRDHAGGFIRLMFNYKIEQIYLSDEYADMKMEMPEEIFYEIYSGFLKWEDRAAGNISYVKDQDGFKDFDFSNSTVHFIGPIDDDYEALNNYSLVFKVEYGDNSMLFTGDMQEEAEKNLIISEEDLDVDILKIGHHGSRTSTSEDFLKAVNPRYAMVSCHNGKHNKYGHPVKATVELLKKYKIPLYRTDELGNIEVELTGRKIKFGEKPGDYKSGTKFFATEHNRDNEYN